MYHSVGSIHSLLVLGYLRAVRLLLFSLRSPALLLGSSHYRTYASWPIADAAFGVHLVLNIAGFVCGFYLTRYCNHFKLCLEA